MVFESFSAKLQELVRKKGFIEPTLAQEMAVPDLVKGNNVLVIAPTGIGKCVSGDTVVITDKGPEKIEDLYKKKIISNSLKKNLKVSTEKGMVIRKEKNKLFLVKSNSGREIRVTNDHMFLTIENGELIWKQLNQMKINDYIACTKKLILPNKINLEFKNDLDIKLNEDFSYFVGLFIGDGNFNQKNVIRFSTESDEILGFIKSYCDKLGLRVGRDKSKKYDYYICSKKLYSILNEVLKIPDKQKSGNVKIPAIFFRNKKMLSSILRGLFDTDGSVYGNQIEFATKSKKLMNDVVAALLSFGIFSFVKERTVKKYGIHYRILIQSVNYQKIFFKEIGFNHKIKLERLKKLIIKKSNPNLDIIPDISQKIKLCRSKMNVSYSRECHFRTYESYAYKSRNPSNKGLLNILKWLEKNGCKRTEELVYLRNLANSDIYWDKIKTIEPAGNNYVYDVAIPRTENFIGNGFVLHNTEAAMLPIFDKISQNIEKHKPITCLYITPTKSLNRDMLDRLFWWADSLDIDISVRHGDTSQNERAMQRDCPPHVLITTPESLGALLVGQKMRQHLKNVKYVIVDEIHELVDNKRGAQLSLILERLEATTKSPLHRIGLSATIGEPKKIADFLGRDVKIIRADAYKKYDICIEQPEHTKMDEEVSDSLFVGIDTTSRIRRMLELINEHKSVIVFTNTRETAEVLSSRLKTIDKGLKQEVHHGSLSKEIRIKGERMFKDQQLKALIATSSLELGIDIGSIDLVIQYLSPRQVSSLIQRVGRSGHKVGETSCGIVLSGGEDIFESTAIAYHALRKNLEGVRIHDMSMDVLAHEILGMCMEEYGKSAQKIFDTLSKAYPYRCLTKKRFDEILLFLSKLRLVYLNPVFAENGKDIDDYTINRSRKGLQYYFENLSTIPDTRRKRIISIVEGEPVGFLDEPFIAEHGQQGNTFICSGRAWRILEVEENKILVEPVDDVESAIPSWEGEMIPVPYDIAVTVSQIREEIEKMLKQKNKHPEIVGFLTERYPVDAIGAKEMLSTVEQHIKKHILPTAKIILVENYKDFIIMHAPFGTMINDTLSRYIASEISLNTGVSVNVKIDPYRIIFQTMLKPEQIINVIRNANKIDEALQLNLERSSLFKFRFIHVAKRFGILSRNARLEDINIAKIIEQYQDSPAYEETLREVMTDKMDLPRAKSILQDIKEGKIKLKEQKGISYIGQLGLSQKFSDVMKPNIPKEEIFRAFKNRLMRTRLRLVCTHCADYSITKEVRDISDKVHCPKCNSAMIGVWNRYRQDPKIVLQMKKKDRDLTDTQNKEVRDIKRSASLMLTYGQKYAMSQAGKGIGVETAARILARLPDTEDKLLKLIYEAEKQYLRTKRYWD